MTSDGSAILIVEDDVDLRSALSDLISTICPKVYLAGNGEEGLNVLAVKSEIVAILSDIQMPVMNGLEFLAKIRSSFNPIPFVIFTAFGDGEKFQEAVRLNATDFLAKPIDDEVLLEVMQKAFDYGKQLRQADLEIEKLIAEKNIPQAQLDSFKRAQKTIFSMRIQNSVYLKSDKK